MSINKINNTPLTNVNNLNKKRITTVIDSDTKLLANFDGSDGATSFTAQTGQVATFNNGAQLDTAQKKFGTASLLLDGDNDYLTFPDSNDWYLDNGIGDPFTIDMWIRPNALINFPAFVCQYTGGNNFWRFGYDTPSGSFEFSVIIGTTTVHIRGAVSLNLSQWYHIAVVRVDNSNSLDGWRLFCDGISLTLTKLSGEWNGVMENLASNLNISHLPYFGVPDDYRFNGWIDELRISKGIARWTSDFIPPTQPYGISEIAKINNISV